MEGLWLEGLWLEGLKVLNFAIKNQMIMTFKNFEEIEAWQLAREMCKIVKRLTQQEQFSKDWELRKQIRNTSGRVMDCIAEGFERGQNNEFKYFLGVSKGSCGEVRSQGIGRLITISSRKQNAVSWTQSPNVQPQLFKD